MVNLNRLVDDRKQRHSQGYVFVCFTKFCFIDQDFMVSNMDVVTVLFTVLRTSKLTVFEAAKYLSSAKR